jgi:hypothetical protein
VSTKRLTYLSYRSSKLTSFSTFQLPNGGKRRENQHRIVILRPSESLIYLFDKAKVK